MRIKAVGLSVMAAAAAALVAACGGGGGGGSVGGTSAIQLSGVAATGLALANSAVDVKCASGTGTATTDESGSYTVTVTDGTMPCLIKVTGTANGVEVTLHSLAEGSGTTATANVTPLTELILARATGMAPAALFEGFSADAAPTGTALSQATTDILTALGDAAGIDLSGVDPFKGALVAATPGNLSGGNAYDQLLDQLGTVVTPAMLPQVVSQVASTAGGTSALVTLETVIANVGNGTLAGCPQALSGKYRVIDYDGETMEVELNFKAMTATGDVAIPMVASESQACEVTVQDHVGDINDAGPTTIVFGPSGAGALRDSRGMAFIFPAQSHTLASVAGKWEFLESGINEANQGEHWVGEFDVAADGKATVCDYSVGGSDFGPCAVDTDEEVSFSVSGDRFLLNYGGDTSFVFGFRAPNGTLTLFGTNNPLGNDAPGILKSSFVLTRPQVVTSGPVGTVSKFWDVTQTFPGGEPATTFAADSITVTALEGNAQTRTRTSDNRVDTFVLNSPVQGMRYRAPGTLSGVYQRFLPGTGMAMYIDDMPGHFAGITVTRP